MSNASKRAASIATEAMALAAEAGVKRAQASRERAGVELSAADVEQVSGALLSPIIRAGGIPVNPYITTAVTNPVLPAVQSFGMVM
jgi:hypothetical protein